MSEEGEGWSEPPQQIKLKSGPIKLRRTRNQIAENLRTLSSDKRKAQEWYYRQKHASPLTRSNVTIAEEHKPPVHQRLGITTRLLRRNGVRNGLGSPQPNRLRLRRTGTNGMQQQTLRRTANRRINPGQQRLYKIRYNHNLEHMLQATTPFRGKLFRRRPTQPNNLTVQVDNTNFRKPAPVGIGAHSVQRSINPQIKSEIRIIQNQSPFTDEQIADAPIFVTGHGWTGVFNHVRFSELP